MGVHTSGYLTATVTNYVGGVAGYVGGALQDCSNSAQITANEASNVGGLAGYLGYTNSYILSNLSNSGAVVGKDYVGGIIGSVNSHAGWSHNDAVYNIQMDKIVNTGSIIGANYTAGCIGYYNGSIDGSYSDGYAILTVTNMENNADVKGTTYVGGLFGYAYSDSTASQILKSKSSGSITAEAYVGGLAGRLEQIKLIECNNVGSRVTATSYVADTTVYDAYVGGYVGWGYYIENCHNAVDIIYDNRGSYVGGIAGRNEGDLINCSNTANITAASANYVGGLVGLLNCTNSYKVSDVSNSGAVVGKDYVGGIIGSVNSHAGWSHNDAVYNIQMDKIVNTGSIIGANYTAGCIGYYNGSIDGSYSDGYAILTVTNMENNADVKGTTYVGGLFGYAYSDSTASQILKSKSSGSITAEAYVGGLAGRLEQIKLIECNNVGSRVTATSYVADTTVYDAYVGGYVGWGYYIENCHNAVDIIYDNRGSYVGGIAGRNEGDLINCSNTANITAASANYVGGLVGLLNCTNSYKVSDVSNSGAVVGKDYVGGVIGKANSRATWSHNDSTYIISFRNVKNSGNVTGENDVAGLIGFMDAAITGSYSDGSAIVTILESTNSGSIEGTSNVGSYIGEFYSDNSKSTLSGYVLTGFVNGNAVTKSTLVVKMNNLIIEQA